MINAIQQPLAQVSDAGTSAVAAQPSESSQRRRSDDASFQALKIGVWLGLGAATFNTARWAAAAPHNARNKSIGSWAIGILPGGPGIHNGIVPFEQGWWRRMYVARNTFGVALAVVSAAIAVPSLIQAVQDGTAATDSTNGFVRAGYGAAGVVGTTAGRTGLTKLWGPAVTGAIIVGAGWNVRSEGLRPMLAAGQSSPWRGATSLAKVGMALGLVLVANESGLLDMFNVGRGRTGDDRTIGAILLDGARSVPDTLRMLRVPFVPDDWIPDRPDAG